MPVCNNKDLEERKKHSFGGAEESWRDRGGVAGRLNAPAIHKVLTYALGVRRQDRGKGLAVMLLDLGESHLREKGVRPACCVGKGTS